MSNVWEGLKAVCMIWITDMIIWSSSQTELASNLAEVLGRLHDASLIFRVDGKLVWNN